MAHGVLAQRKPTKLLRDEGLLNFRVVARTSDGTLSLQLPPRSVRKGKSSDTDDIHSHTFPAKSCTPHGLLPSGNLPTVQVPPTIVGFDQQS